MPGAVEPSLLSPPACQAGTPSVACHQTVPRANLPQGGTGSAGEARAGGANKYPPQLCFSRADNNPPSLPCAAFPSVSIQILLHVQDGSLKKQIPTGAHKTLASLDAVTQNGEAIPPWPWSDLHPSTPRTCFPASPCSNRPKRIRKFGYPKTNSKQFAFKCKLETRNEAGRK